MASWNGGGGEQEKKRKGRGGGRGGALKRKWGKGWWVWGSRGWRGA